MKCTVLAALAIQLAVLPLLGGAHVTDDLAPGTFHGTWHFDRWGQHTFGGLPPVFFADGAVAATLASHGTNEFSAEIKAFDRIRTSGALITELGDITELRAPVQIKIVWREPRGGPSENLRRVGSGGTFTVKVSVTNISDEDFSLDSGVFRLGFLLHHPSGVGRHDPMGWWSQRKAFRAIGPHPKRLIICWHGLAMSTNDQTMDAISGVIRPNGHREHVLKQGETHSWTVTVNEVPPNEYEVLAVFHSERRNEEMARYVRSNVLRLDVLTDRPRAWAGLEVDLTRETPKEPARLQPDSVQVNFKNIGDRRLRVPLQTLDGRVHLAGSLLCYDREGNLLPFPVVERSMIGVVHIPLDPRESHTVPARVPEQTALVRVAFLHTPDEPVYEHGNQVRNGFVLSRHLAIER